MAVGAAAMVSAMGIGAASASASTFEATGGTGVTKGVGVIKQEEFKVWPMTVVCTKATTKGSVPMGLFQTYVDEVKFASCTTFGTLKVTVSPEFVKYDAEGVVEIMQPITITPTLLKCHYTIEPQTSLPGALTFEDGTYFSTNTKLFPSGQKRLSLFTAMKGTVTYTATGWPCIGPKENTELKEAKETEESGEFGTILAGVRDENNSGNLTWNK